MRQAALALFVLAGCATAPAAPAPDWKAFRAQGPYALRIPADMVEIPTTPIDSAVDRLQRDGLTLTLDYGRYGCGVPSGTHRVSTARIDGRQAQFHAAEDGRSLFAQIPEGGAAGECLAITALCATARDCETARTIVHTVDFDPPG